MAMAPFSTFRGSLKQIRVEDFGDADAPTKINAFRWAFPAFLDPLAEDVQANAGASDAKLRRRRYSGGLFSGGKPLPRGRYSTVCVSSNGFDRGGLCRELSAYAGSVVRQRVRIQDETVSPGDETNNSRWLSVYFEDPSGEILERMFSGGIDAGILTTAQPGVFGIMLYYRVTEAEIPNVVDLRLPATQQWFFESFRTGHGNIWRKPNGKDARDFFDLLPTLLDRGLGGNQATDAVGHVLREMGAAALIYPSARCNAGVIVSRGNPSQWYGFNLVDFRDAPAQNQAMPARSFEDPLGWPRTPPWPGVRLARQNPRGPHSDLAGSWVLTDIEQAHDQFFAMGGMLGSRERGDWDATAIDAMGSRVKDEVLAIWKAFEAPALPEDAASRPPAELSPGETLLHGIDLGNLADSLSLRGHDDESMRVRRDALDTLAKAGLNKAMRQSALAKAGWIHHRWSHRASERGDLSVALGEGLAALSFLERATKLGQSASNLAFHDEYGRCLNNVAGMLLRSGLTARARKMFEKALAVDRKLIGRWRPSSQEIARPLLNLAGLYLASRKPRQALSLVSKAVQYAADPGEGGDTSMHSKAQLVLASIQAECRLFSEADRLGREALNAYFSNRSQTPTLSVCDSDPKQLVAAFWKSGRADLAEDFAATVSRGFATLAQSDPNQFAASSGEAHYTYGLLLADPKRARNSEAADALTQAARAIYALQHTAYADSRDDFVESPHYPVLQRYADLAHAALKAAGRGEEVNAMLLSVGMYPTPTQGAGLAAYNAMVAVVNALNAHQNNPSLAAKLNEATRAAEDIFQSNADDAEVALMAPEWTRVRRHVETRLTPAEAKAPF